MRHLRRRGKLDRTTAERKALLKSLVYALLKKQMIITTLAKAKEARRLAEKVITIGKKGDLASQRKLFSVLLDRSLIKEIVGEIAPRFKNRQGGYTRIIRLPSRRKGDNAEMVILELTEQKVIAPPPKKGKKKEETAAPKAEKATKEELPKEGLPKKEEPKKEEPKFREEKRRPAKEDMRPPMEKPKKGFFQGLKRFLKPKTGT